MNKMPKLSVIVPTYNNVYTLSHCLDSIIMQTYENLEVILIDDGSTDGTYNICKDYAKKDARINVLHRENKGLVNARKTGIGIATGEYVSFVDADDHIEPDMYLSLFHNVENRCPDMLLFGLTEDHPDGRKIIKSNKYPGGFYDKDRIRKEIIPSMLSYGSFFDFGILPNLVCKLIKRDFYARCCIQISDEVTIGEDADFTFQLMLKADNVYLASINPYHYIRHSGSMMYKPIEKRRINVLYDDLCRSFDEDDQVNMLMPQLKDYITFVSLLKVPSSVEEVDELFSNKDIRIALYGAGGYGQALHKEYGNEILLWVDKKFEMYADNGMQVSPVDELITCQDAYDIVYIAILNKSLCRQIRDDLIAKGIKKEIKFYEHVL